MHGPKKMDSITDAVRNKKPVQYQLSLWMPKKTFYQSPPLLSINMSHHCPLKWFFTKYAPKEFLELHGYVPYRINEKKVPAPGKCTLIYLVRAYINKKMLEDLVRQNCYGCRHNLPSQMDPMCVEENSADAFINFVPLTDLIENVVKLAKSLKLNPELYRAEEDTTWLGMETVGQDLFEKTFKFSCAKKDTIKFKIMLSNLHRTIWRTLYHNDTQDSQDTANTYFKR